MSKSTNDVTSVELENQELTNWQKIDELEREIERSAPKKKNNYHRYRGKPKSKPAGGSAPKSE